MSRRLRWQLAFRTIRGGGAAGWTRIALMSSGVAAVVLGVLLAWSVPHAADQAAHREQRRAPVVVADDQAAPLSVAWIDDAIGYRSLRRVQIARNDGDGRADLAPAGCARLPSAGTACGSPALVELARTDPDVAARIDGRITQTIGPGGLTGPDELLVYEGHRIEDLEGASRAVGWGPAGPLHGAPTSATVRIELALLVLVPAGLFLVVSARLSATSRLDRSRRLHLIGIDGRDLASLAAVDGWVAGIIGGTAGCALHRFTLGPLAAADWLSAARRYPADGRPGPATALLLVLATAWVVARITAAGVTRTLARSASPSGSEAFASLARVVPAWIATLLLVAYLGVRHIGQRRGGSAELVLALSLIAAFGTVAAVRPIVERAAVRLAGRTEHVVVRLGARRLAWDAAGAVRVLTAPVALVLVAGIGTAVLRDAQLLSGPHQAMQHATVLAPAGASARTRTEIAALPSQGRLALVTTAPTAPPGAALSDDPGQQAIQLGVTVAFGSCAALDRAAPHGHGPCRSGETYRLTERGGRSFETNLPPGAELQLDPDRPSSVLEVPDATLEVQRLADTTFGPDVVFVADGRSDRAWPATTTFAFTLENDEGSIRRFQRNLAEVDLRAHADLPDLNLPAVAAHQANQGAIVLGMALGATLALLALWAATLDRAFERRANVAALAALGLRRSELRWSQLVQLGVPAAVGLGSAAIVATVVGSAYLAVGGLQHGWYWPVAIASITASAAGTVLASAAALVTFGYRLSPESLRRE